MPKLLYNGLANFKPTILSVALFDYEQDGDHLSVRLDNGVTLDIRDGMWRPSFFGGPKRYMAADPATLSGLKGHQLLYLAIDARPVERKSDRWGCTIDEMLHLTIATDRGFATVTFHNEHDGSTPGFGVTVSESY